MKGGSAKPGWSCPHCGRSFKQPTREHSCEVASLEHHLQRASPEVRSAFEALQEVLTQLGPCEILGLKSMIVVRVASNFAGMTITRSRIDLGFFLDRQENDPRFRRVERISATKIAHHVDVTTVADVDEQLRDWLRRSYAIAASRK